MNRILLDTDIILDYFFDRAPYSEDSSELLSLIETKEVVGYVTPVIVSNLYYILRKADSHKKVVTNISLLLQVIDILIIDKKIISTALHSGFKDFEGALQNYSAEFDRTIDVIITRNIKDYKTSNLVVLSPTLYLKAREAS